MFNNAKAKSSYRSSSLLTGRDGQKVLKFINDNLDYEVKFRRTLTRLYALSRWASIDGYNMLSADEISIRTRLQATIDELSDAWRDEDFPAINKLHIIESHLADFVIRHRDWGIYGEQGKQLVKKYT